MTDICTSRSPPQHIAVLLKVKLLSCDDAQLTESSVVSLFLNYNNKKLRVNINVPLKSEQRVEQVRRARGWLMRVDVGDDVVASLSIAFRCI